MDIKKRIYKSLLVSGLVLLTITVYLLSVGYSFSAEIIDAKTIDKVQFKAIKNEKGFGVGETLVNSLELSSKDNKFEVLKENVEKTGDRHIRYTQKLKGIPIWGYQTIVHEDRDGNIKSITGNAIRFSDMEIQDLKSLSPQKGKYEIMDIAKMFTAGVLGRGSSELRYKNTHIELVIYIDDYNIPVLAYYVYFFADTWTGGTPTRPYFLINANTGEILKNWEGLTNVDIGTGPGGNIKIGKYEYGTSDYGFLDVTRNDTICTMENANVVTVNLNHGYIELDTPFSYTCVRNTFQEINDAYSPINDAHYFGEKVYEMYQAWFETPPLSSKLIMGVHYGVKHENAYWTGSGMLFGDGDMVFYPLVSLDVIAHEISHGFTENNSGLIYDGQSGGINESFSDMAGEAAEYYMLGSNDWRVGADIFKAADQALRYLDDPPKDGYSIDNAANYTDYMDVHYSSGVFNKAFYLLSAKSGWNTKMAFEVMVKANQNYWGPTSTFKSAACGAINAASDLGYVWEDVNSAFIAVGLYCESLPESLPVPAAPTGIHILQ